MPNQVQRRSPIAVALLPFVTLGIYSWYWYVKVKGELNRSQNQVHIPTAFVWLIPIVGGIWYMWKFSQATEIVTGGKYSTPVAFLLLFVLGTWLGGAILQDAYNDCNLGAPVMQPQAPYGGQATFNNYYGQPPVQQQPGQIPQTPQMSAPVTGNPTAQPGQPAQSSSTEGATKNTDTSGFPPAA